MGKNAMFNLRDYTTADVLNTPVRRGGILPVTEYPNRTEFDLTSGLTGALMDAFTAPDRARRGEISEANMIPEAFNFAGSLTLGSLLAPRPTGSVGMGGRAKALEAQQPQGIRAFHGSPHDFDRFDMSKIGTGEGAQAYGHGLYFAEAEDVARSYRDALSGMNFNGQHLTIGDTDWHIMDAARKAAPISQRDADFISTNITDSIRGGFDLKKLRSDLLAQRDGNSDFATALDAALAAAEKATKHPGHMYEVRINADPADFLDWDKPLSQQSEKAREAALSAMERASGGITRNDLKEGVTGADAVRYGGLDDPNAMTKALREAGIPGIRYLDQMSRGAGDGSSNYVVFDDNLIEILRKYGLLPPVAAGGLAAALGQEDELY